MSRFALFAALLFGMVLNAPASAKDDPRISQVVYDPTSIYTITIFPGHASVIELQSGEVVESIIVGDPESWLVEATSSGDRVVVKPNSEASGTNMMIVTTKRTYAFDLYAFGETEVFVTRFDQSTTTALIPASYRMRGDKALFPRLLSDNRRTTSVYWHPGTPFPAVFVLDDEGDEIAAEYRAAGDGLIIEGVHEKLIFRSGKNKAVATRKQARGK